MKQKNFNKAMIDNLTEVIFLDEAHPGLLDIDDWKIMCQGGYTLHNAKWKKAQGSIAVQLYHLPDGYGFWCGSQ